MLFFLILSTISSWFKLSALALSIATFDILQLKVHNLVNNHTTDTTWPQGIRRGMYNSIFLGIIKASLVILKFCEFSESVLLDQGVPVQKAI